MRIFFLGDIVGRSGCAAVTKNLPNIIKHQKIDFVVVNGENAANEGVGITEKITNDLGKEKFREELAEYIARVRPVFPLKTISEEMMKQAFKGLKKQDIWQYCKPNEQVFKNVKEKYPSIFK